MNRYRSYALAGGALAAVVALFELVRLLLMHGGATGSMTSLNAAIGGTLIIGVNLLAAATIFLRRSSGFLFGVLAGIGTIAHGVIVRASGLWPGVFYMFAGLALFACTAKSLAYFRSLAPSVTLPSMTPARAWATR